MYYKKIVMGRFISRPNRFIAYVDIDGIVETIHVKNTGRCRELLIKGCTVYLSVSDNPARKTKFDLIAVEKILTDGKTLLINMDSQAPNHAAEEWLRSGSLFSEGAVIRKEVRYGDSRFDFAVSDKNFNAFLEVKGVTLEQNGVAMFPDAPTDRGVKHIRELIKCTEAGYKAYILFVIQMKEVYLFRPNTATHPEFAQALRDAHRAGVRIIAVNCVVAPDSMTIDDSVEIKLDDA